MYEMYVLYVSEALNEISYCSDLRLSVYVGGVVGERLGDSEIDEFQAAANEDEVRGLQVPMHDAVAMYVLCVGKG